MDEPEFCLAEQCGTLGREIVYQKNLESNKIVRVDCSNNVAQSLVYRSFDFAREIFLPHGFPESVSPDYLEYQVWDTLQAFCSTISGTLTTQAIFKGIGVGDASARPLAAAITWIFKDGMGMGGRVVFAWWKGTALDSDCKKWRLFADVLNDTAMFFELLIPYFQSLPILYVTTSMKAIVGVAGGATRAAITQHQAIKGNMADVSAKDGSQETFVNLVASFFSVFLLAILNGHYEWFIFFLVTAIHIYANYKAVCALNIPVINEARLISILLTYLKIGTVDNTSNVNKKESVILGVGLKAKDLCGFKIKAGTSLEEVCPSYNPQLLQEIIEVYKDKNYLLLPHVTTRSIYVGFSQIDHAEDVIGAYFHAILLGIVLCHYHQVPLKIESKRKLHSSTPITRLYTLLKSYPNNVSREDANLPVATLEALYHFVNKETEMFFIALRVNGWNLDDHAIEMGEWRIKWKDQSIKKTA